MLKLLLCLPILLSVNVLTERSEENFDPIIDLLLNGKSRSGEEDVTDDPRNLTAGIWKCGNCTDLDDSKIVYSEDNYTEVDEKNDNDAETKIELVLGGMRCVTVSADQPGVVQRLTGACNGAVTLHMTPARHFIVHVYV